MLFVEVLVIGLAGSLFGLARQAYLTRRERPQKGRYRQFHQVDVEAFGFTSPTIDAEVIELALALPRRLRASRAASWC